MKIFSVPTTTHGRVLVHEPAGRPGGILVVFHGYGQSADETLEETRRIKGASDWRIVAVQALHRFYARGNDQRVIASWMTRQDRDATIADNIDYVDRAIDAAVSAEDQALPLVFLGFSQ